MASVAERWRAAGQGHVLQYLDGLDDEKRKTFLEDLSEVDLGQVQRMYDTCVASPAQNGATEVDLEPAEVIRGTEEEKRAWMKAGEEEIGASRVAVVLLAGGQGTRLGYAHPKGMFDIGLPSGKCLFQIQAERIRSLQKRSGGVITWLVMTSEATDNETRDFFKEKDYFGLQGEDVFFFQQQSLPTTDLTGRVLLKSTHQLSRAPNGNGGVYSALAKSGMLEKLQERSVKTVFVYGVDNVLVRVADPVFVGCFRQGGYSCGSKVVPKAYPEERVGVMCVKNGSIQVVEYSEISEEMSQSRNEAGELRFNAGNIVTHIFTLEFLIDVAKRDLPYHLAKKEIPAVIFEADNTSAGQSGTVSGCKYEQFVFDSFSFADLDKVLHMEVVREAEFSAVKNKEGKDSPATAVAAVSAHHRALIEESGGTVCVAGDDQRCEISPLVSFAGEGLEGRVASQTFHTPVHIE